MIEERLRARVPVLQLAREHEPSVQTLHQWKRALLETNGSDADLREENRRLRQENQQLQEDRDILEK